MRRLNLVINAGGRGWEMYGNWCVQYTSLHETYTGLVDAGYMAGVTLEKCTQTARCYRDSTLIAKDGARVVGFASYGAYRDATLPECGEIAAIYVLREYQGKGVGYGLMRAALARLSGYATAAVWVLKGNERAIRFYERWLPL